MGSELLSGEKSGDISTLPWTSAAERLTKIEKKTRIQAQLYWKGKGTMPGRSTCLPDLVKGIH